MSVHRPVRRRQSKPYPEQIARRHSLGGRKVTPDGGGHDAWLALDRIRVPGSQRRRGTRPQAEAVVAARFGDQPPAEHGAECPWREEFFGRLSLPA
jgi:hypothetical protein